MSQTQVGLIAKVASRYSIEPEKFASIIKQTAFKTKDRQPSNEELAALLAVAERYGLDVWTKQIHAFVDKSGGIVPVVGVDGWNHLEQTHPQFAGERIEMPPREEWTQIDEDAKLAPSWITVTIKRIDHGEQSVTEYLDECYKPAIKKTGNNGPYTISGPWQTHTKRMLRHKARIQAIREVLSYGGIYDQDEAERIVEASYDFEAKAQEVDDGQIIDPGQCHELLMEMERTGLSEDSVRKNLSLKAGYSGELADMPLIIFEALMLGLASMPGKTPSDDDPAGAAPETAEEPIEGEVVSEAAETQAEPDEGSYWPTDDTASPEGFVGMDAEQARAHWAAKDAAKAEQKPRSAAEAGRRAAESAERARAAKPIIQKQVSLLYAQCTIHGVDEKAQLHAWLRENIGVEHVPEIPAARFDEVLGWVQAHEKGGVAA